MVELLDVQPLKAEIMFIISFLFLKNLNWRRVGWDELITVLIKRVILAHNTRRVICLR
jgi:hypothetical protein